MASSAQKPQQSFLSRTWEYLTETQIWKSIFRHGMPATNRNRVLVVMTNVFLHLHPVKIRKSGIRLKFTWCMGGLTFFLFLVETFTGLLLMFYYRPTVAYAYMDIIDLAEQVPLGVMRELHRCLLGLVAIEFFERATDGFVQVGALGRIQRMIEIVLKKNVAEAIAGKPLPAHSLQRLGSDEPVAAVEFAAQSLHYLLLRHAPEVLALKRRLP